MSDDLPKVGRGGRGAAMQQFLKKYADARKPGAEAASAKSGSSVTPSGAVGLVATVSTTSATTIADQPTTSGVTPAPRIIAPGRGAALEILRQKRQQQMMKVADVGDGGAGEVGGQQEIICKFLQGANGGGDVPPSVESKGACAGPSPLLPVAPPGRGRGIMLHAQTGSLFGLAPQLVPALPEIKKPSPAPSTSKQPAPRIEPTTFESAPDRPPPIDKRGSAGKKVPLCANYIALRCKTEGIYQYYVSFEPIIDCSSMRAKMVYQHRQVLGDTLAFDGMTLYLPKKLEKEPTVVESIRHTDSVPIVISFKLVKIVAPHECIHLYNIIFKKIMRALNMCVIGRNYYMPSGAQRIPKEKLEVWPGYVTSCAEYQGGVMLLADVSHRVLRTQTAYELMEEIMCSNRQTCQDDISKLLVGNVVLTRYNNKCYRIDDINWNKTPRSTFNLYNGETLTFAEYYKRMYDIKIQCMDQPLLLSVPKKKQIRQADPGKDKPPPEYICLIPELSYITGLTDTMRADNRVMRELASHTRLNPAQRRDALRTYCTRVNEVPEARKELERWGFELDRDLMQLEGRLLPIETIRFRGDASVSAGPEADWSRAVTKNETIVPVDLNDWLIFATKRDMRCAEAFVSMYRQCSRDMGIRVREGQLIELPNDRTESYMREIKKNVNQRTQLVVTIFPFQREDRYSAIKQLCCHDMPIPSQVINSRTISDDRKLRSVTQKIALQINCKLGGELWALNIPAKNLMVCGVDVTHDPAQHKSSVVGFVSNINQTCTRWYSKVRMQQPGEEIVNGLKICFTDALRKYYEVNHEFPTRVVIYRDGVGDGQLGVVRDYEVKQLIECFDSFKSLTCKPKLGVIVVQKRINTRMLSLEMNRDQPDNPKPGTVVDHTITRTNWYDFFIVSQHIRQGTVSPTHYVVVYDGLDWKPDIVQALTYKMTHLYYNWPGTVRVPAPCQYAHKLAFLIGQNVRKMPDERLNDRLYYL